MTKSTNELEEHAAMLSYCHTLVDFSARPVQ
jgi:hypothetical protein